VTAAGGSPLSEQGASPNFDNLLALTAEGLQEILAAPQIDRAWSLYGPILAELCQIEDLKTGGVNPGDRRALFYLVSGLRPKSVLEIGTNVGASTIHIAVALDGNAAEVGRGRLVTVDIQDVNDSPTAPWRVAGLPLSARQRIETFNGRADVTFITAASLDFLAHRTETFDCIFLDGDHSEDVVFAELVHASRLLNPGGVIILHDFFPEHRPLWSDGNVDHGPVGATERLRAMGAAIDVLPLGALPWPTKYNSHVTSLAVVVKAVRPAH
jgi:predicted O-methyltransferase YrrM